MAAQKSVHPTKGEFRILKVLWNQGPCTVRQVQEGLRDESGYTTVLKLMQIMLEKGLLSRNEKERTHVYTAAVPEVQAKRGLVQDLIEKAFGGSAQELILQALSSRKSSPEELSEIRRMIDTIERKKP